MRLAASVLRVIDEVKIDQEAVRRYQSLPGIRDPFVPFSHADWIAMSKRMTRKYGKQYKCAVSFSEVHFEIERAGERGWQLPIVERMIDLALSDPQCLSLIRGMIGRFSNAMSKGVVEKEPGRGYYNLGGFDIKSISLGYWLISNITTQVPYYAMDGERQTIRFITCSMKRDFKTYPGDKILQVESLEDGDFLLTVE